MALDLTWLGCDLVSGQIIEELPALVPTQPLRSVLAEASSLQVNLPIPLDGPDKPPDGWPAAVKEARTMLVAVLSGTPIWAAIPLVDRLGTDPATPISCVTLEGYFDHRYVGNHTWTQQDEASVIAAGLIGDAQTEGIDFTVDAPATGTLRDRTYLDSDDKSVYSALRELMGVLDGPEWTIALAWTDATQTAVEKIFRVRRRIGMPAGVPTAVFDNQSAAVFDAEGAASTRYEVTRDFSSGKFANHVVAVSSGQGDGRPQSVPARDETQFAGGIPRWEHRFTPSTSISDIATLNSHAARTLELMKDGAQTLSLSARADAYPRLGYDWGLGDDVGYNVKGHGHPDGLAGTARAVGWELDVRAGTVSPIVLMPGEEVA